jgi:hypothetical protein
VWAVLGGLIDCSWCMHDLMAGKGKGEGVEVRYEDKKNVMHIQVYSRCFARVLGVCGVIVRWCEVVIGNCAF